MAEADPQKTFNVHEAKTHFSRLVDRAHAGEEIVLAKDGVPWAKMVPIEPATKPKRTPGRFRNELRSLTYGQVMASCFSDEELQAIENAPIFPSER